MSIEVSFDPDMRNSAFALGASWQAAQFERIEGIRAQIAALEAEEVRVLAGLLYEAEGEAAEDAIDAGDPGEVTRRHDLAVRSVATEYAATARLSLSTAQARLGEAWTLTNQLLATLAALEHGEVSRAHAHEIAVRTEHLTGARPEAEQALLPLARTLPVAQFRRRAKRVLDTLEHDSIRARYAREFARRRVEISAARDGMAHLDAYLDAADAALIITGLTNAANEARALGDTRTTPQLQADLFTELLLDGNVTVGASDEAITGTLAGRAPVSVEVLIPAKILAGRNDRAAGAAEVPGLGVIDPKAARRLVSRAPSLRRILTDPVTSAIIDFDRTTYRVPAELKRVIRRRDGHCRAPGCAAPVTRCEIDHTQAAAHGGPTALWNLAHLCDNHHHLKHEAGWGLTQYAGGALEWTAPSGRHYTTYAEADITGPPGQPADPWNPPDIRTPLERALTPAPFDADADADSDADSDADVDDHEGELD
jgi:hypothetical protein